MEAVLFLLPGQTLIRCCSSIKRSDFAFPRIRPKIKRKGASWYPLYRENSKQVGPIQAIILVENLNCIAFLWALEDGLGRAHAHLDSAFLFRGWDACTPLFIWQRI